MYIFLKGFYNGKGKAHLSGKNPGSLISSTTTVNTDFTKVLLHCPVISDVTFHGIVNNIIMDVA